MSLTQKVTLSLNYISKKTLFFLTLDRATLALILSIIAILLSISKWIYDAWFDSENNNASKPRHSSRSHIRIERLEEETNCFITRGGFLLFLVSFRIYNDSDQVAVSISECNFCAKIGRTWHDATLYDTPQANIFLSLIRHNLPLVLEPEQRQDFYEVFALDDIIPSTEIKTMLELQSKAGISTRLRQRHKHRVDERPVFDLLFRILE